MSPKDVVDITSTSYDDCVKYFFSKDKETSRVDYIDHYTI